MHKDNVIVRS